MNTVRGNCPVCNKPLLPTDDVVTCPSCGASYHRACYNKEGHCLFQDKHGTGFEYTAKDPNQPPPGVAPPLTTQTTICPKCRAENDARNIFCERCGSPLHSTAATPNGTFAGGPSASPFGNSPFGSSPLFQNPMANTTLDGTIDDIPVSEFSTYIGKSSEVYIARMKQQDLRKSKTSFTISAFFLGPLYFAYRKMWGWAALAFLIMFIVSIPSFMAIMYTLESPLVSGINIDFLNNLSIVASLLNLIYEALCGIFAVYLYRKHVGKKIRKLREIYKKENEYTQALVKTGGVSVMGAVVAILLVTIVSYAIMFFVTTYGGVDYTDFMQMMTPL